MHRMKLSSQLYGLLLLAIVLTALPAGGVQAEAADKPSPDRAFGEAEYRLGPEDVLSVFVWKQPDLSTTVVIRPARKISLPLLGEIEAAGKNARPLQTQIPPHTN